MFEDGLIRQFIEDSSFDLIIQKAIQYHSLFVLPEGLSDRELLHCRMIRDADKLDNFRVKETEDIETFFDAPEAVVALESIHSNIMDAVRNHQCVRSADRITHMDYWVSFLAFTFDLNFSASFRWILEHDYLNRNVDRIQYKNPKTKENMEEVRRICCEFILAHSS